MTNHTKTLVLAFGTSLLFGCMGTPGDGAEGAGINELIEVDSDVAPLRTVDSDGWQAAPTNCHNRLIAVVDFELVRAGVVVALDASGEPVCVDTIDNVRTELERAGRVSESSDLGDAYLLAMGFAIPAMDIASGDPSPQPSCRDVDSSGASPASPGDKSGVDRGDPSPQPSTNPHAPRGET